MRHLLCTLLFSVSSLLLQAQHRILNWDFPLSRTHTGVLIGNGLQGLIVWGKDHQLNITVSRAGFWDRRAGKPFGSTTDFPTLRRLLETHQDDSIKALFKRTPSREGFPDRSYQLGGGRLEVYFPEGYTLLQGKLNLSTAQLTVLLSTPEGALDSVQIAQAVPEEVAWLEMSETLLAQCGTKLVSSYDHDQVKKEFSKRGLSAPTTWEEPTQKLIGFTQAMPADAPLGIAYQQQKQRLVVATHLGKDPKASLIQQFRSLDQTRLKAKAQQWWQDYTEGLPKLQLPDPTLQELYDYGMYKMGAVHPPHGLPASLQAAFMETQRIPPWSNDYHLNINLQMIYWPAFASGKFDHFTPLWKMIQEWMPSMKEAGKNFYQNEDALLMPHAVDDRCQVVGTFWTGTIDQACAAWMAQMAWLHYRYTLEESILTGMALPLMKGAFEGYYAMTDRAADGTLSLPVSVSPEFKGSRMDAWGKDASFQLAAYKMTAHNLIKAVKITGDPVDPRWEEVQKYLPDYAIFEGPSNQEHPEYTNQRIALWEGMDLVESHRHHSHLAGIYPFASFDPFAQEHRKIVQNSISNWVYQGAGKWSGWCVPWAATLHARLGNVDAALSWLKYWEQNYTNLGRGTLHDADHKGISLIQPHVRNSLPENNQRPNDWNDYAFMEEHNETMQLDGGFGVLDALHNLMLQQRDTVLHVVPYIPTDWRDFAFEGLHVEGGFIIGARVEEWELKEIVVRSPKGGTLQLASSMPSYSIKGRASSDPVLTLSLAPGEEVRIQALAR